MTEKDLKTRKQWLALLIIYIFTCFIALFTAPEQVETHGLPSWFADAARYSTVAVVLFWQALFYYCAYKKRGTKFLTFVLIITPIASIFSFVTILSGETIQLNGWQYFLFGFQTILSVLWYMASWKMRMLNKRLQRNS